MATTAEVSILDFLRNSPKGRLQYEPNLSKEKAIESYQENDVTSMFLKYSKRQEKKTSQNGADISDSNEISSEGSTLNNKSNEDSESSSSIGSVNSSLRMPLKVTKSLNPEDYDAVHNSVISVDEARGDTSLERSPHLHPSPLTSMATYSVVEVELENEYKTCRRNSIDNEREKIDINVKQFKQDFKAKFQIIEEEQSKHSKELALARKKKRLDRETVLRETERKLEFQSKVELSTKIEDTQRHKEVTERVSKSLRDKREKYHDDLWTELCGELQHHCSKQDSVLKSCSDPNRIENHLVVVTNRMGLLLEKLMQSKHNMSEELHQSLLKKITDFGDEVNKLSLLVDIVNKQVEEEKEKERLLQEEQKRKAEEEEQKRKQQLQQQLQEPATPPSSLVSTELSSGHSNTGPQPTTWEDVLRLYNHQQDKLDALEKKLETLTNTKDSQLKDYRFTLQKAVSNAIATACSQSAEHLLGKVQLLSTLFNGGHVEVTGKKVSILRHSAAKDYVMNLFCKKVVHQALIEVSSHFKAAFPLSVVVMGVWSRFPEIGDLLMAHFQKACPILVPLKIPTSGVTESEYKQLLGYSAKNGELESEESYLKKMSGVINLFSAMLLCPPLIWGKPNPLGLSKGWTWIALVLNMDPMSSITATALLHFLEVAGFAMMRGFGSQFNKLIVLLANQYYAKIEAVTPANQKGPLARLKHFLENCIKTGTISPPEGNLGADIWKKTL